MASAPVFIGTPKTWHAVLAVANTNRDGSTGTYVTVMSAGAAPGSRIDSIRIEASGTTTAGVVRLFLSDGTNARLFKEVLVSAITPSASVEAFMQDLTFPEGIALPNGWSLKASTHNSEGFNVFARGGDFV
jgi:polygalacturonase